MNRNPFLSPSARAIEGKDCSALDGILDVECLAGSCNVLRCQDGYAIGEGGDLCIKASNTTKMAASASPNRRMKRERGQTPALNATPRHGDRQPDTMYLRKPDYRYRSRGDQSCKSELLSPDMNSTLDGTVEVNLRRNLAPCESGSAVDAPNAPGNSTDLNRLR